MLIILNLKEHISETGKTTDLKSSEEWLGKKKKAVYLIFLIVLYLLQYSILF